MSDQESGPAPKTPVEQAVEHAVEVFVYAPIGLLFEGASLLPQLIEKGKSQVTMARMIGQFAVTQGQGEAEKLANRFQDQAIDLLGQASAARPRRRRRRCPRCPRSPRPTRCPPRSSMPRPRPTRPPVRTSTP